MMTEHPIPQCHDLHEAQVTSALASLLPDCAHGVAELADVAAGAERTLRIPYSRIGAGPPLLLLHGHPQTRAIWAQVAPALASRFTVVLTDLRGYGDADKPTDALGAPPHAAYTKRAMAADQIGLMRALGFERFAVVGHDRGARVAHRLALDYPQAVTQLMLLDIAPTLDMYEQTDMAFARAYWHWFYLIQPAPLPETMINADPVFYLRHLMGNRSAGLAPFPAAALAEYLRAAGNPDTVRAMCEDYRASAGPDLELDRADRQAGRLIQCPLRVLWGEDGIIGKLFDPLGLWRAATAPAHAVTGEALACGHYLPEEAPERVVAQVLRFLGETADGAHAAQSSP